MTRRRIFGLIVIAVSVCCFSVTLGTQLTSAHELPPYDLVLANGRVMDPETELDAIRHIGIRDGRIAEISVDPLDADESIDVSGMVVAPGFIDIHAHGQDRVTTGILARDGVTTALEMEGGVMPVDEWYRERDGKARLHYGATVSHPGARIEVLEDDPDNFEGLGDSDVWSHKTASPEELEQITSVIDEGLEQGALGVGFGIQYTPGATRDEIWRAFKVGESHGVAGFAHVRFASVAEPGSSVEAIQEMLAIAATGPSVHICHLPSSGLGKVPILLEMLDAAQRQGLDVTTEVYPYAASSTFIGAAIFDPGWREKIGRDYSDIAWAETGERLTEETFLRYRKEEPDGTIVAHVMDEEMVEAAMAHPGVMVASDGGDLSSGRGHPRGAGTHARVLRVHVRERQVITLMKAIKKMTLLPAQRLEAAIPDMRDKGRLQVGADADITVFDPEQVTDHATFDEPARPSSGIPYVLVNGTFVVKNSKLVDNASPGQPIRRPIAD